MYVNCFLYLYTFMFLFHVFSLQFELCVLGIRGDGLVTQSAWSELEEHEHIQCCVAINFKHAVAAGGNAGGRVRPAQCFVVVGTRTSVMEDVSSLGRVCVSCFVVKSRPISVYHRQGRYYILTPDFTI